MIYFSEISDNYTWRDKTQLEEFVKISQELKIEYENHTGNRPSHPFLKIHRDILEDAFNVILE
jgi:hypothetical protein